MGELTHEAFLVLMAGAYSRAAQVAADWGDWARAQRSVDKAMSYWRRAHA